MSWGLRWALVIGGVVALCFYVWVIGDEPEGRFGWAAMWLAVVLFGAVLLLAFPAGFGYSLR